MTTVVSTGFSTSPHQLCTVELGKMIEHMFVCSYEYFWIMMQFTTKVRVAVYSHALQYLLPWAEFEHANREGSLGTATLLISIGPRKKWPSTLYSLGLTVSEEEGSGSCSPLLAPSAANKEIEGRSLSEVTSKTSWYTGLPGHSGWYLIFLQPFWSSRRLSWAQEPSV